MGDHGSGSECEIEISESNIQGINELNETLVFPSFLSQ